MAVGGRVAGLIVAVVLAAAGALVVAGRLPGRAGGDGARYVVVWVVESSTRSPGLPVLPVPGAPAPRFDEARRAVQLPGYLRAAFPRGGRGLSRWRRGAPAIVTVYQRDVAGVPLPAAVSVGARLPAGVARAGRSGARALRIIRVEPDGAVTVDAGDGGRPVLPGESASWYWFGDEPAPVDGAAAVERVAAALRAGADLTRLALRNLGTFDAADISFVDEEGVGSR